MATSFKGNGIVPGVAMGPVHRVLKTLTQSPIVADSAQVLAALDRVALDIELQAKTVKIDSAKTILDAQVLMARDPMLIDALSIAMSTDAKLLEVRAILDETFSKFKKALTDIGGYFAARTADLDEIFSRLTTQLTGEPPQEIVLTRPSVVIAGDLSPAETAMLDLKFVLALLLPRSGPTSHTAIVARSLGIPVIVGCDDIETIAEGTEVIVNAREGEVLLSSSDSQYLLLQQREEKLRSGGSFRIGPCHLLDGAAVPLLANIGNVSDVSVAVKFGAEGIGLFRTELLFLEREDEPSIDEQVQLYVQIFEQMKGLNIVVRTLDAGSDKPIPFVLATHEQNPALGIRGWRLTRTNNEIISRQILAIAQASIIVNAGEDLVNIQVMAPMISSPAEAKDFALRVRAAGLQQVGVMIETPAAVLHADKILPEVDFASLGTNDLCQYVMAADRLDTRIADFSDPWQPAVLMAVSIAAESARKLGKPMGVCGEAASNPYLAAVFIGLGCTSLSMSPFSIPEVRNFIERLTMVACREAAVAALSSVSETQAEERVRNLLSHPDN